MGVLTVNNPYSAAVTIKGAQETITYTTSGGKSAAMGVYTHCDKGKDGCADDLSKHPITMEANAKGLTPTHNVKTAGITEPMLEALREVVCGGSVLHCKPTPIPITIGGWMDVVVGSFEARVNVTEAFDVHFTGLPVAPTWPKTQSHRSDQVSEEDQLEFLN